MSNIDFILITQSEVVNYEEYSKLPLDRIELCHELIFPRMVYCKDGFRSHLDVVNYFQDGVFFAEADYPKRRTLLNIWNLPGMNSFNLANYLSHAGIRTKVINNFDAEWDLFCKAYESAETSPLVGISTTFYLSYAEVRRMIKQIRNRYPLADVVLGGAFVNTQLIGGDLGVYEKPMRKYGINYILPASNSEADIKDLILARKNKTSIDAVCNLAYIAREESSSFRATKMCRHEPVLADASVCWDQVDAIVNHTVQMRTSSGCPFSCAFCSYPKAAGAFCMMSNECVEEHLKSILRITGVNKIVFIDDTFNVPAARFKDMCRLFCKYKFEWFSFLRVQFIDEETVKLMKDSGCRGVYLGIESANDAVLENMNKKATRSQYLHGLRFLRKYDITTVAAFIIGFPGETENSIEDNIDFIETAGIDFYTLKEFYYMKHTPIYEQRAKFELSGIGNKWQHNTMDSARAYQEKIKMFKTIKNSIFIDADMSLWYVAYLYDQGYSMGAIAKIQKEINAVIMDQINGVYDDEHPSFNRLRQLLSKEAVRQ